MKACLFPLTIVGGAQTLSPTLHPSSKASHQRKKSKCFKLSCIELINEKQIRDVMLLFGKDSRLVRNIAFGAVVLHTKKVQ
jgi:uracil DNA glycosylase